VQWPRDGRGGRDVNPQSSPTHVVGWVRVAGRPERSKSWVLRGGVGALTPTAGPSFVEPMKLRRIAKWTVGIVLLASLVTFAIAYVTSTNACGRLPRAPA
jgi:hypothetical protein